MASLAALFALDRFLTRISDLLTRHRRISCSTVTKGRRKESQTRIRGACDSCATAKVRCSPSLPCTRCAKKGIPCTKRAGQRSTDLTECDDPFLVNQPLLDRSPPVHGQLEASRHNEDTGVRQCLSSLSTPLLLVDSGRLLREVEGVVLWKTRALADDSRTLAD
jgi:hypothetical protein